MKKTLSVLIALVLLLTVAASAETITVGMEGTYAPYTYYGDDGELTGFEVDVANAIGEKLGYDIEFVASAWDSLFPALDAGNIDVIMNQVTITQSRLEAYDFTTPYVYTRPVLIVAGTNEDIKTFEDLAGKKAAEGLTSNFNEVAQSYGAEIVGQDQFPLAMELVISGEADAVVNDELTYAYWLATVGDNGQTKIVASGDDVSSSAIVLKKGRDELRDALSGAVDELLADGTIAQISARYFGIDVSQE